MHTDPVDRRRPRLAATLLAGAGLLIGIPAVLIVAAAVEFGTQARKALAHR